MDEQEIGVQLLVTIGINVVVTPILGFYSNFWWVVETASSSLRESYQPTEETCNSPKEQGSKNGKSSFLQPFSSQNFILQWNYYLIR